MQKLGKQGCHPEGAEGERRGQLDEAARPVRILLCMVLRVLGLGNDLSGSLSEDMT